MTPLRTTNTPTIGQQPALTVVYRSEVIRYGAHLTRHPGSVRPSVSPFRTVHSRFQGKITSNFVSVNLYHP